MSSKISIIATEEFLRKEALVIQNLDNLAHALKTAVDARFMSHEHGKTLWKGYLQVSGMDIPKSSLKKEKGD